MVKTIKIGFVLFSFVLIGVEGLFFCNVANADKSTGYGLETTVAQLPDEVKTASIGTIIGRMIRMVLTFVGVIFTSLMFYAGFLWMNARGNEQNIEKAKDLMIWAIIGMAVVIFAYAITMFVDDAVKKVVN